MLAAAPFILACPGLARAGARSITVIDRTLDPPVTRAIDVDDIANLRQHRIETRTDFTDGRPVFEGPYVSDVLLLAGGRDWTVARMIAANDYSIEIPVSDFERYGVILAHSMDGKRLSLRDKGPYWVMYPMEAHQELDDPVYNNRLIWQLVKIELR